MRFVLYILSFVAVMALGSWAYRENYATQAAQRQVAALQDDIAALREQIAMANAEWAYLNRPSRLRALANANFASLGLAPMEPGQFGSAASLPLPAPPALADRLSEVTETSAALDAEGTAP